MKEIKGWKVRLKQWSFLLGVVIGPFLLFVTQWLDYHVHDLFLGVLLRLITMGPFFYFYIYGFLGFVASGTGYCPEVICVFEFEDIILFVISAIWWCFLLWFIRQIRSKGVKQGKG